MQTVTQLKNAAAMYKNGFPTKEIQRVEKGRSQKLKKAEKDMLCQVVADQLTATLCAICPVTGLITRLDFPAMPGMYFEAHHPIVHNVRAMLSPAYKEYLRSLIPEQKAGFILAALDWMNLAELKDSALVVNMALATTFTPALLDSIITFICNGCAHTKKSYPKVELAGSLTAEKMQKWIDICDEIEHFNPERIFTLEEAVDLKLFDKPKLISTDKQLAMYDKSCFQLWEDMLELDVLPADLIKKAKPFVKTLVSTKNGVTVERLVDAVLNKWAFNDLADASLEEQKEIVESFCEAVLDKRESAARLGAYDDLVDILDELSDTAVDKTVPGIIPHAVEAPSEANVQTEKKMSFAERAAMLKAKAAQENN